MKRHAAMSLFLFLLVGCSSGLVLKPGDFSWPIESVMKPDAKGFIQDNRNSISVNVKDLVIEELKDSLAVTRTSIHMIRDGRGFYFVTAPKFKSVYVLAHVDGGLKVEEKINVSETGLADPAFNLRGPVVQLLNGREKAILLSKDGIQTGGAK